MQVHPRVVSWRQRSFEVLPALTLRRKALRQSLRTVTAAWMFGVVWMACISGSQMTLFGRLLGFRERHFGLLAAIPFGATFAQLLSAVLIERSGLRKYQFIYFATIHRLLWVAMAGVGLLMEPGPTAVTVFLALFAVSSVLQHMSSPAWQTWMGDLIPRRIRGRYFAARSLWTIPIQVTVAVASGVLLDAVTRPAPPPVAQPAAALVATAPGALPTSLPAASPSAEGEAAPPPASDKGSVISARDQPGLVYAIAALFAVGGIFGAIDILLFLKMREIVSPALVQERPEYGLVENTVLTLRESVRVLVESFRDRVFRHYAMYGATIGFSATVGGQFFWLYALENLHYSKLGANLTFLVFSAGISMGAVRLWGRLIDRWGRRPLLMLCTLGVVFGPAGWFFIPHGNMLAAYALGIGTCMMSGGMWRGVELARLNIMISFAESPGRSRFMAAAAVVAAVGGFLGGLCGGELARMFRHLQEAPIGPFRWNNYHVTFLASAIARGAAVLWLIGMPEPGARPFRLVVRDIWSTTFNNVAARLPWPLRVLPRRMEPGGGERPDFPDDHDHG